ncbi:MAG: trimeric intracellular cation channel family protein [Melioribacteraceae bacterium]|nr:trimeric intracellular cation channel family protein [Melioribacteraceae bacterium]
MIYYFDLISVLVCSITGALASMDKKIDGFGLFIIGTVAGIGGGTVRDIILGRFPVFWISDNTYFISIAIGTVCAVIFANTLQRKKYSYLLLFLDALGLAIFTIIGADAAIELGKTNLVIIIMAMTTGVVGGMLRDILCNEIPLILRREIYALASIIGAIVYIILLNTLPSKEFAVVLSISITAAIRLLAIKYKLSLPHFSHLVKK